MDITKKTGEPRRIAIVDDRPEEQYLYPEFLLAQRFFQKHGVESEIVDAMRPVTRMRATSIQRSRVIYDPAILFRGAVQRRLIEISASLSRYSTHTANLTSARE